MAQTAESTIWLHFKLFNRIFLLITSAQSNNASTVAFKGVSGVISNNTT